MIFSSLLLVSLPRICCSTLSADILKAASKFWFIFSSRTFKSSLNNFDGLSHVLFNKRFEWNWLIDNFAKHIMRQYWGSWGQGPAWKLLWYPAVEYVALFSNYIPHTFSTRWSSDSFTIKVLNIQWQHQDERQEYESVKRWERAAAVSGRAFSFQRSQGQLGLEKVRQ